MSEKQNILSFEHVAYSYKDGGRKLVILKDASYDFEESTFYSIIGPSGSGKTTTLSLAGALDIPEKGSVLYKGKDIRKIGLTKYRRDNVAMVFQNFNLISYMSALENVQMAFEISGKNIRNKKQKAIEILRKLGLSEEECKRNVRRLSGGQQQRVAVARALASEAKIILADEPTGNLDSETAKEIVSIFKELASKLGKCVIVVTHSVELSQAADKVLRFNDGGMELVS